MPAIAGYIPWHHHKHNDAAGLLFSSSIAPPLPLNGNTNVISGSASVAQTAMTGPVQSGKIGKNYVNPRVQTTTSSLI